MSAERCTDMQVNRLLCWCLRAGEPASWSVLAAVFGWREGLEKRYNSLGLTHGPPWMPNLWKLDTKSSFSPQDGRGSVFLLKSRAIKAFVCCGETVG